MQRPSLTLSRKNFLSYIMVGSGWIVHGVLTYFTEIDFIKYLDLVILIAIAAILIYSYYSKADAADERYIRDRQEAYSFGFYAMICSTFVFLLFESTGYSFLSVKTTLNVILGIGLLVVGIVFHKMERDGEW